MSESIVDTLMGFRENTVSQDFFLRSVLRHPRWHIPVDRADHPVLWTLGEGGFVAAQSAPVSPDGSPVHWITVDGRHLIRNLPADCAGLVFELGTPAACVIELDGSADTLTYWASVLDVEDALLNPAPGQILSLLNHQWLLLRDAAGDPLVEEVDSYRVVHLFTAPDRLRGFIQSRPIYRQSSIADLDGRRLFEELSTRSTCDATLLHYGLDSTEVVGPNGAGLFVDNVDGRSCARILPARTIAEIHLFLDLEGASREGRIQQLEYLGDDLVAHYTGTVAGARRSWWFQLVQPTGDPADLGPGPSEILCAGQLADLVRRRLRALTDHRLDADELQRAAESERWVGELEKMLVGGSLPRSAVRTPDGSRYLREFPEMATAAWIGDAHRRVKVLAAGT